MRGCLLGGYRLIAVPMVVVALCATAPANAGRAVTPSVGPIRPLVIAHRGASGVAPENTMASFEQAVKFGADMIELDVHGSKDGNLIVIHDSSTARTARGNPQGAVADLTLGELKKLDAGAWKGAGFVGERIPTLDEVLAAFKGRAMILIELKARGIEQKVAQAIREAGCRTALCCNPSMPSQSGSCVSSCPRRRLECSTGMRGFWIRWAEVAA